MTKIQIRCGVRLMVVVFDIASPFGVEPTNGIRLGHNDVIPHGRCWVTVNGPASRNEEAQGGVGCHPGMSLGDHRIVIVVTDEEIYRKYSEELTRFAQGLVGRVDSADIVSAAVLQSISAASWSRVTNHRAYLYRAVLNQARKTHRDRQRRWNKELRGGFEPDREVPEVRPEVLAALSALSPRQRAVIVLTYWDDLPTGEIAEFLGLSEGSVKKHLARARSKLRGVLHE